ncbi:MAG: hypothetical protein NT005_07740 [Spirochaetes bacterium]|jgi:hypothetical protein|nr:hypothetical protein [Spirochaetota bacterium]
MSRDDYVFCIGFEGSTAIVDGRLARAHAGWTAVRLAEAGLFKPALAAALYDGSPVDLDAVLALYNARAGSTARSIDELKRTFGTSGVPDGVKKIIVV